MLSDKLGTSPRALCVGVCVCAHTHVHTVVCMWRSEDSLFSPFTFMSVQEIKFRWPAFEASSFPHRTPVPRGRNFYRKHRFFFFARYSVSECGSSGCSGLHDVLSRESVVMAYFVSISHDTERHLHFVSSCLLGVKCQDPKSYKSVKYFCELR